MFTRIAIVGAGACGLYLAKNLRGRVLPGARIDLFERLPHPLGLLRYGVAPDSLSIRDNARNLLDSIQERFFYNIRVGYDIGIEELLKYYHVCILACGSEVSKDFPIPGDDAKGVFDALDLVRWYNGHPEATEDVKRYFELLEAINRPINVSVIGNGNVSLDIARILLTPPEELESTDINKDYLKHRKGVKIQKVDILGRRGIIESSFSNAEVRKILDSRHFICYTDPENLDKLNQTERSVTRAIQRKIDLFKRSADNASKLRDTPNHRLLKFDFYRSVHSVISQLDRECNTRSILSSEPGSIDRPNRRYPITQLVLDINKLNEQGIAYASGQKLAIDCDMLIKCVGFDRTQEAKRLLPLVDNKRVFSCGWFATNGKGDLSNTLAATVALSRIIANTTFDFPVEEDIVDLFMSDPRYKHVRTGSDRRL
ncbi:NAD(P)-binding Rossmann-like domain family protein [Babesia bovis T2Bo]|uniref:Uncharacterized protein n=1 Tax=Babesia bovis TaxID=5865 RepID=A7AX89_BABBO|nr:NAD(P)-binding Rossmann-like domain family protein [Babesia bovis T2Bo]EDO05162.1 NAD(P)-binding Rossmann-like domain family protein [Babesia bovis T2Bo]|eukprot:XP_001608730.1 hypothetical protein [Babesia bovis T2Bo]